MKKLNNKGYMLVEIILASVLAFGVAYFIIDLTIKLKNKNDDLVVETQVVTDQTIISNKLMNYLKSEGDNFDCKKLNVNNNKVKYNNNDIDLINNYVKAPNINESNVDNYCEKATGEIKINIPLSLKQQKNKNYDIDINYKYEIGDMTPPTCTLKVEGTNVVFNTKEDNAGGSGISTYGIINGNTVTYNDTDSVAISIGNFSGYVKDRADNEGSCTLEVKQTNQATKYSCYKSLDACSYGYVGYGTCYTSAGEDCGWTYDGEGLGDGEGGRRWVCTPKWNYFNFDACSGTGWTVQNNRCYKYNQSNCNDSNTGEISYTYSCDAGYTQLGDNYCYKIN